MSRFLAACLPACKPLPMLEVAVWIMLSPALMLLQTITPALAPHCQSTLSMAARYITWHRSIRTARTEKRYQFVFVHVIL